MRESTVKPVDARPERRCREVKYLPGNSLKAGDDVEVSVPANHWECVLQSERCDPNVVRRNRLAERQDQLVRGIDQGKYRSITVRIGRERVGVQNQN